MSTNTDDILISTSQGSSSITGDPVEQLQPTTPATALTDRGVADGTSVQSGNAMKSASETRPLKGKSKPPEFKTVSFAERLLANPPIPESLVKIICSKVSSAEKCAAVKQLLDEDDDFLAWTGFDFYVKHSKWEREKKTVIEKDQLGFSSWDSYLLEFVKCGWAWGRWSENQRVVLRRGMKKYAEQIVARIAATHCPDCIPARFIGVVEICGEDELQEEFPEEEDEMEEGDYD